MGQRITFYGAAQTVTGSKHLLEFEGHKVLVDCGLFQGSRELRDRNWHDLPFDVREIEAIVITHAHLDHIGWLPRLVKEGYSGPIYATHGTVELARISLPDSGRIQEEDARHHTKHGSSPHKIALPLYTEEDAYACMKQFESVPYNTFHRLPGGGQWRYLPAGHILGSAFAETYFANGERIMMSGDLGRYNTPIIKDPTSIEYADYLVVESTYGDRLHPVEDPMGKIETLVKRAMQDGGAILVPSFSIGRTQELLYYFSKLQEESRIPRIPIFVDSPMATSTTRLYERETEEHDSEMQESLKDHCNLLEPEGLTLIRDVEQSKALNSQRGPMVIIAGSGMANAGRILHHMLHRISNPETIVLFTGYQAQGTLGRQLLEGADTIRIYGQEVPVRATIDKANALSAHADQGEIMKWLHGYKAPPKMTFIVHGEPPAQAALQAKIEQELGWKTVIPAYADSFDLA